METSIKILSILIIFIVIGSTNNSSITKIPKNYIFLSDSLFVNKYETTKKEYFEYLRSIKNDSTLEFHQSQLPDSIAITFIIEANTFFGSPNMNNHFLHPAFEDYPITGITLEQALNFCLWKTAQLNRVNSSFVFEIRLPTIKEWEQIATYNAFKIDKQSLKDYRHRYLSKKIIDSLGIDYNSRKIYSTDFNVSNIELLIYKNRIYKFAKTNPPTLHGPQPQPRNVENCVENEIGIKHLIGNISELTQEPGIAKGLNFSLPYSENFSKLEIEYFKPEPWLGFRTMLEMKKKNVP